MNMNIFAVKDDVVQTYYVTMDEKAVKRIQASIDEWNGKGEFKEVKAASLMSYVDYGKKIEVVSRKYAGKGEVFDYCCPSVDIMDMYNYKFYQYTPHPLSSLCESLLKDYQSLDFSQHIAQLLSWNTEDEEEKQFVEQLVSSFTFKRLSVDDIVQSDLTLEEKRTVLKRIMDVIKKKQQVRKVVATPKSYEEEVENKIRDMEVLYSGFYGRELHGEEFKFTSDQEIAVRRKILATLPSSHSIMKVNK